MGSLVFVVNAAGADFFVRDLPLSWLSAVLSGRRESVDPKAKTTSNDNLIELRFQDEPW